MIRVLILDEARLICEVIAAALEEEPDVQVVSVATSLEAATPFISQCDIALVSSTLPDDGALQFIRTVTQYGLPVRVLVLGLEDSEILVLRYIEAGAAGYVLREESVEDLLEHVRAAAEGKALVSPEIAARLMARVAELAERQQATSIETDRLGELSEREREVLVLIGQGLNNQEIAQRLTIEVGTVKNHVHNIFRKLNVRSRKDAAGYADFLDSVAR